MLIMHSCFLELQNYYATRMMHYLNENTLKGFSITQMHSKTVGMYSTNLKMHFNHFTMYTVSVVYFDMHYKTLSVRL